MGMGMKLRGGLACAAIAFAIGVSACGGGGGSGLYSLSDTQSCMDKAGYQTATLKNPSLPGSEGNLRVQLSKRDHLLTPSTPTGSAPNDDFVFLVFDKSPAGALATQKKAVTLAIQSFEHQSVLLSRAGARAGVALTKNVFYYSPNGALTSSERTKVTACLR
jgi:hypothetical protein